MNTLQSRLASILPKHYLTETRSYSFVFTMHVKTNALFVDKLQAKQTGIRREPIYCYDLGNRQEIINLRQHPE